MDKNKIVKILQGFWPKNKAKGQLAQAVFHNNATDKVFGDDGAEKIFGGCWLIAPKEADFYKFRFSFFIHDKVEQAGQQLDIKSILGDKYRPLFAVSEFMNNAGIGAIYVIPVSGGANLDEIINQNYQSVQWKLFALINGEFNEIDPVVFFGKWGGGRGRPTSGNPWDPAILTKIGELKVETLSDVLLNELFYTGYIKSTLRKVVSDPYDVDAFLISLSQKHIIPMEIREKFAGTNGGEKFFGIDAGRILMLLRLCLPNDANAIYLIRELDENNNFIDWKYILLSDIVMASSWNLQAGGRGMGGQDTQTVRLPYTYFKSFNRDTLKEDNLKAISNLPEELKGLKKSFKDELIGKFY